MVHAAHEVAVVRKSSNTRSKITIGDPRQVAEVQIQFRHPHVQRSMPT
jgi:hypothetical protein